MPTAPESLPPDTQALVVTACRERRWYVPAGNTLELDKAQEAGQEESGASEDVKRHVAMWERFRVRLEKRPRLVDRHPKLRGMAEDIRFWEASKAGVNLADERKIYEGSYTVREWFMHTSAAGRVELVKAERERRAAERRFKLAQKRISQAA